MFNPQVNQYLQLGIFRLEDVCVRVQDGMEGFFRTAALEKTSEIEATFRWLLKRNIRIALICDANRGNTNILLERLGWSVGEGELIQVALTNQKTKLNPVQEVLDLVGLPNGDLAFSVFDTPRLLSSAQLSRVQFNLGITSGRCNYAELSGTPHHALLDVPVQIPNFLLENMAPLKPLPRKITRPSNRMPLFWLPPGIMGFV